MSYFNTIHFECPNCMYNKISVNTKSGKCKLKDYHFTSVPVDDASKIANTEITCPKCNTTFYIGMPTPRVRLILTEQKSPDEIIYS